MYTGTDADTRTAKCINARMCAVLEYRGEREQEHRRITCASAKP